MSIWKRIGNLFSKPVPQEVQKSMLNLSPGDICEVSLVTNEVTGRTHNREQLQYGLYKPIDGRLCFMKGRKSSLVM